MEPQENSAPSTARCQTNHERETADELRPTRDHLAALVQSIEGIVWEADAANFRFTYVSPQAERLLGYPSSRWTEEPAFWVEHLHPEDREWAVGYCHECCRQKRDHEFEYRMRAADGRWIWLRDIVSVVLENGELSKLRGIMLDVTQEKKAEAALRESVERFELVSAGSNDAIWDWDLVQRKVNYSPRWLEMRGFALGELSNSEEEWRSGIHPEDLPRVTEALRDHFEGKTGLFTMEYRIRCKDGSWKWILDRGMARRDATGRAVRMAGSETDVTERRQTLEALAESRRLLEKAQQVGRIGSWVLHLGPNQKLAWSAETCRIFGLRPDDFDGRNESFFNLVHPDDLEAVARASVEARSQGRPYQIEHRIVRPDGEVRWVREQADVETDPESRQPVRMIGVVQDITEQKRAEEELKSREEHFRLLIENASDLITVIDRRGIISYQSPASRRALGVAPEELVGRSAFDFVHPDDAGVMAAAIQRALKNPDSPVSVEYRFRHLSGGWRTLQSIGRNIPDKSSEGFIVVNSRDMTESRALEQQLAHSQKLQAVGTLAGGIAHDFNNLLGAIVGNADLALVDLPPEHPAARCLGEILRASERARQLVDRILAFGRPREPQREMIVLSAVVEEAVRLLRSTLPAGVELQLKIERDLPPVRADVSQIHQVVLNLGTNSWHALEGRAGRIVFSLEPSQLEEQFCRLHPGLRPGPHVCLTVADTGKGMDAPTLRRIFEPFFTTKPPGQGTGLGLSVVHGIVHSHGGGIVVESRVGQGSEFRVFFPAVAPSPKEEPGAEPPASGRSMRGKGEHIMFVDDEAPLVMVAVRSLERLGYRVTGLTSPLEAWEAFLANPASYDLVLTDYNMPSLSGLQLAAQIMSVRPDLPILMASGFLQPDQAERATELGIRELMAKPYTTDMLSQLVQRWVAKIHPAAR